MALALINHEGNDGTDQIFRIDLGRNRFHQYAIGDEETVDRYGVRLLANRAHVSDLFGPLPDYEEGRAELRVPSALFTRDHDHIQLYSFRTRGRDGPAASAILRIDAAPILDGVPTFAAAASLEAPMTRPQPIPRARHRHASIRRRPPLSTAQFLDGLVSLLPSILPAAGQILRQVIPALGGAGAGAAPRPPAPSAPTAPAAGAPSELLRLLQDLLAQAPEIGRALASLLASAGLSPAAAPPVAPAPAAPSGTAATASYAQSSYSQAFVAPIVAALPALMPLLQQVLSPQTIQGILQTADPNRLIGTVTQGITDMARLGLQGEREFQEHLRALNPGVDDPALMALLGSLSVNVKQDNSTRNFKRSRQASIHFADANSVTLDGRSVVAYLRSADVEFPLSLESPQPLPPSYLKIRIKDARNLKVLAAKGLKTPPLSEGRLPVTCRFSAEELAPIQPGQDCLVCADLVWKTKSGERRGATRTQACVFLSEYTFDGVGESSELVALDDVDKDRDYWHKVWEGEFEKGFARATLRCEYFYRLEKGATSNELPETTVEEVDSGLNRKVLRLTSGLLLSPNRLNELLSRISPHPMLDEAQMAGVLSPGFLDRFNLGARFTGNFGGRRGQRAALWVYPHVKVQTIRLLRPRRTAPNGNILEFEPVTAHFPIPALAHFLGVASS